MMRQYRRTALPLLPILLVATAAFVAFYPTADALAELTATFELDGDAITGPHAGLPDDWDRTYAGTSAAGLTVFQTDPQGVTLFKSGSKDIYDMSAWQWSDQNAPPKDDITNAYAAVYANKIFFGADRYSTGGTAYLGFWLLKGTVMFNADGTVTGSHQVGDILILANFLNGGGTVVPRVFEWVGSGGSEGSLNERAVDINSAYALVNSASASAPWPYAGKTATGYFPAGAFFEGGADLGALGITGCFTDFICESRSSAEVGAELKDFIHHSFPASPTISVSDAAFCEGGSARLCAVTTGGVPPFTFAWSPTGSNDSCITVTTSGWYRVTVTGANGCSGIDSAYVTVYPQPACNITGTNAICAGQTTEFCATCPPGSTCSWSWVGPLGFTASTSCTGLISVAGTYTLTITDSHGCQNTCSRVLTVYGNPTCNITGANAICSGQTTEFCGPDVPGYTYDWGTPPGYVGIKTTRCIGPLSVAGTYTLTVTDANGCQNTCSRTLTVYTNPTCGITHTGGERDTICPCFDETDPSANNEYCGPAGMGTYAWSIVGGGSIVGATTSQCVIVRPRAYCDTTFTLSLTIGDGHGCTSSCDRTIFVVDKTPPVIVYCPPDTVLECSDNLDDAFNPLGVTVAGGSGPATRAPMKTSVWEPIAIDDCDGAPGADYADTGGRPTNWSRRVDSWGGCGEDTTVLRTWTVADDCGNKAICRQVIAIQDTVPPVLTCAVNDTVSCGTDVVFTPPPSVADNCDPLRLLDVIEVSTDVTPGPDEGEYTHTRCWAATDSCGNASALCCQSITVEACPENFCTFTQGAWGNDCTAEDPLSLQAGCILDRYFSQVFPNGSVGIGDTAGVGGGLPKLYAAVWTNADAVQAFLPAGGTSGMLTSDATNPVGTNAGVLAGQLLALRLNVEFSCAGVFKDAGLEPVTNCYRGLVIPASCGKFAGMTVEQFLAVANEAVGGKKSALNPYGATLADLNVTASCLNMLFDNCVAPVSAGSALTASGDARQTLTADEPEEGALTLIPPRFFVRQSYPNPFNPSATIVFGLPREGRVTVEICDVAGRNVVTLLDAAEQAGYHTAVWFGRDSGGNQVASGVYFCRVRFDGQADVQKLILLR